jgi:uncharacterized protein (UPF0332 family)
VIDDPKALLAKARDSLAAAEVLAQQGFHEFSASRAYYAMFYVARALLRTEGLSYSRHAAVIAAFGQHFAKTERVPRHFHRYLIDAQDTRTAADYDTVTDLSAQSSAEQIQRAHEFIALGEQMLGSMTDTDEGSA